MDPCDQCLGNLREEDHTDPAEQPATKNEDHRNRRRLQEGDQYHPTPCNGFLLVQEVDKDQSAQRAGQEEQQIIREGSICIEAAKAQVERDNLNRNG